MCNFSVVLSRVFIILDISRLYPLQITPPPFHLISFSPYSPFHSPSLSPPRLSPPRLSPCSSFHKEATGLIPLWFRAFLSRSRCHSSRPIRQTCRKAWLALAWLDPLPNAQQFVSWHYGRFIQGRDGLLTKDPSDLWLLPSSRAPHNPLSHPTGPHAKTKLRPLEDAFEQVGCGAESDVFYYLFFSLN